LKAADVGVAMGITGTDVAKGAADIVLQDDKFTTIEKAVKEGRNIYENVKKSILFSLSSNICEVVAMFVAILLGLAAPLKAVHILWINLLTDSLPCFALGVDPNSASDVMNKKPRKNGESLFANGGYMVVGVYGVLMAIMMLVGYVIAPIDYCVTNNIAVSLSAIRDVLANNADVLTLAQTLAFCTLACGELTQAIGMRDLTTSLFKFKHFDNKVMILAIAVGIVGQLVVTEIPVFIEMFGTTQLSLNYWLIAAGLALIPVIIHEVMALIYKARKADK
jgi:Ca2+-transporting ATPase